MRKMRESKKIFSINNENRGAAIVEFAFFIPIAMTLFYFISDFSTLYGMKYKIQTLAITTAQNTLAVIGRKNVLTQDDFKEIGETAIMAFQGNFNKEKYNLEISWQCIRKGAWYESDRNTDKQLWSARFFKDANNSGSASCSVQNTTYSSSNELLNLSSGDSAILITVTFSQSDPNSGFYKVSPFTYNIIKGHFKGKFEAKTILPLDGDVSVGAHGRFINFFY